MAGNAADNTLIRTVMVHNIFSFIYTSLIVLVLLYFNILYSIGKRSCWPLILSVVLAECFKSCICFVSQAPSNAREKHTKVKKYFLKNKLKGLLAISSMVVVYYIIAVLFGAPFLEHQEETLMFSLLLTALTVVPACLSLGADATISLLTGLTSYQGDLIVETIKRNICLTLFGAWLGAVVIPLDWDRPWQVWPIPCSFGAVLGYIFSHVVSSVRLVPKVGKFFTKKTGKYGL